MRYIVFIALQIVFWSSLAVFVVGCTTVSGKGNKTYTITENISNLEIDIPKENSNES